MLSSILQTKHRGKNTPRQGFPRDHCKSDGGQGIILFYWENIWFNFFYESKKYCAHDLYEDRWMMTIGKIDCYYQVYEYTK